MAVLEGRPEVGVRLAGIDAPETGQPYGRWAKQVLAGLVVGKTVRVDEDGIDRNGRVLGAVHVRRGYQHYLVRSGAAWVYPRYSHDPALIEAERLARAERRGLWSPPNPTLPWGIAN